MALSLYLFYIDTSVWKSTDRTLALFLCITSTDYNFKTKLKINFETKATLALGKAAKLDKPLMRE